MTKAETLDLGRMPDPLDDPEVRAAAARIHRPPSPEKVAAFRDALVEVFSLDLETADRIVSGDQFASYKSKTLSFDYEDMDAYLSPVQAFALKKAVLSLGGSEGFMSPIGRGPKSMQLEISDDADAASFKEMLTRFVNESAHPHPDWPSTQSVQVADAEVVNMGTANPHSAWGRGN